jgi:hypothetical protein
MESHADKHRHGFQVEKLPASEHGELLAMAASRSPDKRVLSVRLSIKQIERLKRVCRDGAGKPLYLTLASLVENALTIELDRVEKILDQTIVDPDEPTPLDRRTQLISRRMQRINNSPAHPARG